MDLWVEMALLEKVRKSPGHVNGMQDLHRYVLCIQTQASMAYAGIGVGLLLIETTLFA